MKYVKMLGLLALAAAAMMMAFAGTASAELTEGPGDPVDAGEHVHAHAEGTTSLDGSVDVACGASTVTGEITNAGGTSGPITHLTFTECGKDTVTTLKPGSLSISSKGVVTSAGAEITVQLHRTVLGFPITTHCVYATKAGTSVGTLTDSLETGETATLDIGSSPIPQNPTDSACGENAEWTGNYKITTPDYLVLH